MNKPGLSERLVCIASNVKSGGIVADIGCDHAFTSIYLVKNGIAEGAIAMDINKAPLERAQKHILQYGVENKIFTRLCDGAKGLGVGEADTILISGMGGALIVGILSDSIRVVNTAKELVLSPQSEIFRVRHFLHDNGFMITNEDMVKEQGKFYVVIRAVHGTQRFKDEACYKYGDYLINNKNKVLKEFLIKEKGRISRILNNFYAGGLLKGRAVQERKSRLEMEYDMIEKVLDKIN